MGSSSFESEAIFCSTQSSKILKSSRLSPVTGRFLSSVTGRALEPGSHRRAGSRATRLSAAMLQASGEARSGPVVREAVRERSGALLTPRPTSKRRSFPRPCSPSRLRRLPLFRRPLITSIRARALKWAHCHPAHVQSLPSHVSSEMSGFGHGFGV